MLHIKIAQAIGYNAKWRATHTRCPFALRPLCVLSGLLGGLLSCHRATAKRQKRPLGVRPSRRSSESKGFPVMHDARLSANRSIWPAAYSTILSGSCRSPRDAARSVAASPRISQLISKIWFCSASVMDAPFRKRCVTHILPFGPAAGGPFCCRRYPACAAVWPRLRGRVAPPLRRVKGAHETPHKPPLRSGWWRSSWTSLDPPSLRCGFAGSKADDDARRRHSALPAGARC